MKLKPGVFVFIVIVDLVQMDGVEIGPAVVVVEDRAASPIGAPRAVFILQADV